MKDHIRQHHKFQKELVSPGCHRRCAAEMAIRNSKANFLSVMAGTAESFPIPTDRNHIDSTQAIQFNTAYFSICTHQRPIRLQQNATHPHGM